jgi:PIN domain
MNENVPDSLVTDFEQLIPTLSLPDPDDRHVLAAAITANAKIIITFNLKDFPDSILVRYGIVAQHPDVFVSDIIERYPQQVLQSVDTIVSRLKNPPQTFDNHLETLANQGLITSVAMLRDLHREI